MGPDRIAIGDERAPAPQLALDQVERRLVGTLRVDFLGQPTRQLEQGTAPLAEPHLVREQALHPLVRAP